MSAPDQNAENQTQVSSLKTKDLRLPTSDFPVAPLDDCWNRIGVGGNQTCGELARVVHCHNCGVYARAAGQFLDRPLPVRYRLEWTDHFARERPIAIPAKTSAVLFRIGPEWLGMPTPAFQEIAELPTVSPPPVPGLKSKDLRLQTLDLSLEPPDFRPTASRYPRLHSLPHRRRGIVLGLVNVRGELLICASLGKLLGLESTGLEPRRLAVFDRMLVTDWQGQRFAFPVDEVHGVHRFHTADLREPPATVARSGLNCAIGVFPWRHYTVGFLDPESLFAALNRNLS